jgi:ankyrin repeat protein
LYAQLLHEAVAEEQLNIVKLLISRGADINALTEEGLSPHNIAIDAFGNEHLITAFLKENGASTSELGWQDDSFDDRDDRNSEEHENEEVGVDL